MSNKDRQVLDFIVGYIDRVGYAPSIREIGKAVGLTSTGGVARHVNRLAGLGFLRVDSGVPRGIVVLRVPEVPT